MTLPSLSLLARDLAGLAFLVVSLGALFICIGG